MKACALSVLCWLLAACATGQSYDGERRANDEVARIIGDLRVTAGAPVSVILRKVDDYELAVTERSVEVLPGPHRLLVDCRIAETNSITRLTIEAELYAGESYRLVAEIGPGLRACTSVNVEAID